MLYGHDVHPDEFNNPMMATGRAAASQTQKSEATTKKSSNNRKTVDWTREETEELLQAWGPKFEELKKVSTKERGRIWSEIYNKYKERFTESVQSDDENSSSSSTSKQEKKTAVENRKMCKKSGKSSRKVKRRRKDSDSDWQERFENMWERSLEQEREGRESTQQIIRESLRSEMEQTNAIMAGFKDIFQNLLK